MFQYSPSEKEFVKVALANNLRVDGRAPNQRRTSVVKSNILDNLAGSSYVSIDHGKCEIYTGVKLKVSSIGEGQEQASAVYLEVSSMRKLTRQQGNTLVYMQQLLQNHFINKGVKGLPQLKMPNSKTHCLQMHIESFILSEPHLSLIEPLYLSIRNALLSTSVPKLECIFNQITNQQTVELTSQSEPLALSSIDSLMLIGRFEGRMILDLSPLEFESVESVFLLTVRGEKVQSVQSLKGSVETEGLHKICKFALANSKSL